MAHDVGTWATCQPTMDLAVLPSSLAPSRPSLTISHRDLHPQIVPMGVSCTLTKRPCAPEERLPRTLQIGNRWDGVQQFPLLCHVPGSNRPRNRRKDSDTCGILPGSGEESGPYQKVVFHLHANVMALLQWCFYSQVATHVNRREVVGRPTHTPTHTETHHTHQHTHIDTHPHKHRHTDRDTQTQTQTDTHGQTHTDRHTQTDTHRQTQTHSHTDSHTHRQSHTQTQTHTQTPSYTQRHTERDTDLKQNVQGSMRWVNTTD